MDIVITIYLLILSIFDVKKKKIPLFLVFIPFMVFVVLTVLHDTFIMVLLGMVPGILVCLLSFVLKGKIGLGDGMIAILYGICYGFEKTCIWIFFGFWTVAVYGIVKTIFKKRKEKVPFIPFLACVHLGGKICGIL